MFRMTCLLKALCTPRRLRVLMCLSEINESESRLDSGDKARDDGRRGDPSVVLYPGGSSSSSSDRDSSRFASAAFQSLGISLAALLNLLRTHCPTSSPTSLSYFFFSWVSSKKRIPITTPHAKMAAHTTLGSRKGNRSKIVSRLNTEG